MVRPFALVLAAAAATGLLLGQAVHALDLASPVALVHTSSTGAVLLATELDRPHSLAEPLALDPLGALTLKLAVVADQATGKPVSPHQASISFGDVESGRDVVLPLTVRPNGKAKLTLDAGSLPAVLRQTSGHLTVTLQLGAFDSPPISYRLFTLSLPSSTLLPPPSPKAQADRLFATFGRQPELEWSFAAEERPVGLLATVGGLLVVLAPWTVLLTITSKLDLPKQLFPATSGGGGGGGGALPFLLALGLLESTTVAYWFAYLKLFRFLTIFLPLALGTAGLARRAFRVLRPTPPTAARRLA